MEFTSTGSQSDDLWPACHRRPWGSSVCAQPAAYSPRGIVLDWQEQHAANHAILKSYQDECDLEDAIVVEADNRLTTRLTSVLRRCKEQMVGRRQQIRQLVRERDRLQRTLDDVEQQFVSMSKRCRRFGRVPRQDAHVPVGIKKISQCSDRSRSTPARGCDDDFDGWQSSPGWDTDHSAGMCSSEAHYASKSGNSSPDKDKNVLGSDASLLESMDAAIQAIQTAYREHADQLRSKYAPTGMSPPGLRRGSKEVDQASVLPPTDLPRPSVRATQQLDYGRLPVAAQKVCSKTPSTTSATPDGLRGFDTLTREPSFARATLDCLLSPESAFTSATSGTGADNGVAVGADSTQPAAVDAAFVAMPLSSATVSSDLVPFDVSWGQEIPDCALCEGQAAPQCTSDRAATDGVAPALAGVSTVQATVEPTMGAGVVFDTPVKITARSNRAQQLVRAKIIAAGAFARGVRSATANAEAARKDYQVPAGQSMDIILAGAPAIAFANNVGAQHPAGCREVVGAESWLAEGAECEAVDLDTTDTERTVDPAIFVTPAASGRPQMEPSQQLLRSKKLVDAAKTFRQAGCTGIAATAVAAHEFPNEKQVNISTAPLTEVCSVGIDADPMVWMAKDVEAPHNLQVVDQSIAANGCAQLWAKSKRCVGAATAFPQGQAKTASSTVVPQAFPGPVAFEQSVYGPIAKEPCAAPARHSTVPMVRHTQEAVGAASLFPSEQPAMATPISFGGICAGSVTSPTTPGAAFNGSVVATSGVVRSALDVEGARARARSTSPSATSSPREWSPDAWGGAGRSGEMQCASPCRGQLDVEGARYRAAIGHSPQRQRIPMPSQHRAASSPRRCRSVPVHVEALPKTSAEPRAWAPAEMQPHWPGEPSAPTQFVRGSLAEDGRRQRQSTCCSAFAAQVQCQQPVMYSPPPAHIRQPEQELPSATSQMAMSGAACTSPQRRISVATHLPGAPIQQQQPCVVRSGPSGMCETTAVAVPPSKIRVQSVEAPTVTYAHAAAPIACGHASPTAAVAGPKSVAPLVPQQLQLPAAPAQVQQPFAPHGIAIGANAAAAPATSAQVLRARSVGSLAPNEMLAAQPARDTARVARPVGAHAILMEPLAQVPMDTSQAYRPEGKLVEMDMLLDPAEADRVDVAAEVSDPPLAAHQQLALIRAVVDRHDSTIVGDGHTSPCRTSVSAPAAPLSTVQDPCASHAGPLGRQHITTRRSCIAAQKLPIAPEQVLPCEAMQPAAHEIESQTMATPCSQMPPTFSSTPVESVPASASPTPTVSSQAPVGSSEATGSATATSAAGLPIESSALVLPSAETMDAVVQEYLYARALPLPLVRIGPGEYICRGVRLEATITQSKRSDAVKLKVRNPDIRGGDWISLRKFADLVQAHHSHQSQQQQQYQRRSLQHAHGPPVVLSPDGSVPRSCPSPAVNGATNAAAQEDGDGAQSVGSSDDAPNSTPALAEDSRRLSETQLRAVFSRCDASNDGEVSVIELIKSLRRQSISSTLQLPANIRQEDGTRDKFEEFFQTVDVDGNRKLTWEEFAQIGAFHRQAATQ